MKKKKLINILLLLVLSFSISHAFIIEHQHHHSNVHEYVNEFSHTMHEHTDDDYDFHCEFHISYILADNLYIKPTAPNSSNVNSRSITYVYYSSENFLKPPIS